MKIIVVDDEPCPRCGAYWGHPDKELDFPNRIKVDDYWRCYNPKCTCAYYRDGMVVEDKLSPEEEAKAKARAIARMEELARRNRWITRGNTSRMIPKSDPLPAGWVEGVVD